MVNTVDKGRRNQDKAVKILEARGYTCETAKFTRWGSTDYHGLWDIWAVKEGSWLLVQVGTNERHSKKHWRVKAEAFWVPKGVKKEEWIFIDYKKEPKIYGID